MREEQDQRPRIMCEGIPIDNVAVFKYLGTLFSADGQQIRDINVRIAQAFSRCGELHNVLNSKSLSVKLRIRIRIRLYEAAVCSILTYGCETWVVTEKLKGRSTVRTARWWPASPAGALHRRLALPRVLWTWLKRFDKDDFRWLGHRPPAKSRRTPLDVPCTASTAPNAAQGGQSIHGRTPFRQHQGALRPDTRPLHVGHRCFPSDLTRKCPPWWVNSSSEKKRKKETRNR